jgi:hypothetical protein
VTYLSVRKKRKPEERKREGGFQSQTGGEEGIEKRRREKRKSQPRLGPSVSVQSPFFKVASSCAST